MALIPNIYKGNYLLLSIPALILLLASLYLIFVSPHVQLGVDFKGGMLISLNLEKSLDPAELQAILQEEGYDAEVKVFNTSVGMKAEIEAEQSDEILLADQLKDSFEKLLDETASLEAHSVVNDSYKQEYLKKRAELDSVANLMFGLSGANNKSESIENLNQLKRSFLSSYNQVYKQYEDSISLVLKEHASYSSIYIQSVSPKLSTHFLDTAFWVVLASAILSILMVFFFFKSFVPSLAVILGAFCDVIMALGAMAFFQIPLTLPSFAALLMLVGYSLDTDILLTMRMMKTKGDPREKAFDAMKTGTTMTLTGLIAFAVLFVLSIMTNIPTYFEISAVALAGLVGDLFATWGINAVILLSYVEKKGET